MLVVATALMLFSMFFGAGNLIFPPMLGVEAGESFLPAILGFLGTGVLLPVLAIIAIALSGNNLRDLANRGGWIFGLVFPILAYLSIGAFYALPRTGAVAYETAIQPLTGWDGMLSSGIFNFIFFGVALALAWNPNQIVATLGKFLTPILLVLLVILVALAVFQFDGQPGAPLEKYDSPAAAGLLEGYLTMDAIAGLAFGIVVISALRYRGMPEGGPVVRGTIWAGLGAGVLLALIYLGLGFIGQIIPDPAQYDNGAGILAGAAELTMGTPGQIIFGLIVLLACLTTAVGLISATSEFFHTLTPGINYRAWAIVFSLLSFALATMGLDTVLAVAAPIIGFIYPPAITLIFITLLEPVLRGKLFFFWAFRLPIWVAVIWSALTTLVDLGWGASFLEPLISWAPMQDLTLGWVLPTVVALVIGLIIDVVKPHPAPENVKKLIHSLQG
nr:branched-chain amino acid transport system II carrier protein [Corynebacterium halotolerans]